MDTYKIVLYIVVVFLTAMISYYNIMRSKKNKATNAYASLDVMLKKRYDLIPNLVKIVKEYSDFEKEILKKLSQLRKELLVSNNYRDVFNKNIIMTETLNEFVGYAEAIPDLKANDNYLHLQNELSKVEDQISAARRTYNAHVTKYNNFIQFFPNNIFAFMFGFKKLEWFTFKENEKIEVNINENS